MRFDTRITRELDIELPIIQAPMAGGIDGAALAAAVGEAGGLGCIGGAYRTPQQITDVASDIRARSNHAFGINLFAPQVAPPLPRNPEPALAGVAPFYAELGLDAPPAVPQNEFPFREQVDAAMASGASVFSFTFGIMPDWVMTAARAQGMFVIGTATTVVEAVQLQANGVDAIVAQGADAGGHRGSFPGSAGDGLVGTMALVPQVVDAVGVPVIASGGIMDGRGLAAALMLGAEAVQLGTAFLVTDEAATAQVYKDAVLAADEDATRVTRAFSGRPARGIANRFMNAIDNARQPDVPLDFPHQNALTRAMRAAATAQGRADMLSLWAGQGLRLTKSGPAGALVRAIAEEADAAFRCWNA